MLIFYAAIEIKSVGVSEKEPEAIWKTIKLVEIRIN